MVCRAFACAFGVGVEAVYVQWTLLSHSLGRFLLAMTKSFCFFLLIKENGLLSNECLYHTEIKSLTLPSWKCLSSRRERERERKGKRQSSFFRAPYAPFLLYNIFSSRIVLLLLLRRNYKYLSINSLINGFTSAGFSSIGQCPTPFKTVNPAFAYFSYNFLPSSIFSHGSFSPHNINVGVAFSPWLT